MWRSCRVLVKCVKFSPFSRDHIFRRTFLSESYKCCEAWERRLESPLLSKVDTRVLYQELDTQFSLYGRASALDVDLFVNASTRDIFIEDVETLLTLLRLSPDTGFTLPSTHHGVVRLLLDANKQDTLLRIIRDPLKYGIFPDHYCCNLMMDTFLKEKRYAASARVAVSLMLQEDWEKILTNRLAVYSCHMYLNNQDQPWYLDDEIINLPPEPKELVKVRVKYIRKPYFDDHFDLKDPCHLVGKTLMMFSSKIRGSEALCASYLLTGMTLCQKWDKVLKLVQNLSSRKIPVYRDALQLAQKCLQNASDGQVSEDDSKPNESESKTQLHERDSSPSNVEQITDMVDKALKTLETNVLSEDFLHEIETLVKESVSQEEESDIESQIKLYKKWEEDRTLALKKQQEEIRKEETLKQIEQLKKELIDEEREIFFFDNEDKLDLLIEEREAEIANLDWLKEQKVPSKQLKEEADVAYIPPEVTKRHHPH